MSFMEKYLQIQRELNQVLGNKSLLISESWEINDNNETNQKSISWFTAMFIQNLFIYFSKNKDKNLKKT